MRRRKGARLWLRPARRNKAGKVIHYATWIILDRGKHIATGCAEGEADRAEQLLATYISEKYSPGRQIRDLELIDIADVLSIYVEDCATRHTDQKKFLSRIGRLNEFWGGMVLSGVMASSCRRYVQHRGNRGAHAVIWRTCGRLLTTTPRKDSIVALCVLFCPTRGLRAIDG